MREYGQIQSSLWIHPKFGQLTGQAKLLLLYFLSGPHTNGLGCFRVPLGYVSVDLNWNPERVTATVAELFENGWIYRCEKTHFIHVKKFLEFNSIPNPNSARAREREFDEIPTQFTGFGLLSQDLLTFGSYFSDEFVAKLKAKFERPQAIQEHSVESGTVKQPLANPSTTVSEPLKNPSETVPQPFANQEQEQEQEQEQYLNTLSGRPDDSENTTGSSEQPEPDGDQSNPDQHQGQPDPLQEISERIINRLNLKAGRSFRVVKGNVKFIRARLRDGFTESDLNHVIDAMCNRWLDNPEMHEYLRPSTLFNDEKFNQYVDLPLEAPKKSKGGQEASGIDGWVPGGVSPFDPDDDDAIETEYAEVSHG